MGQGARRGKVVALLVALALVAVAVPLAEPVWTWVTTKRAARSRVALDGHELRGYVDVNRWSGGSRRVETFWFARRGLKAFVRKRREGHVLRRTTWDIEGKLIQQYRLLDDSGNEVWEFRNGPPWWWGVKDQASPSMPEWMKDDELWAKALEEAKAVPRYGDPRVRPRPAPRWWELGR